MSNEYSNIRNILGPLIGARLADITQHDEEEFADEGSYVMLLFEGGKYLKFPVGEAGFHHNVASSENQT